MDKFEILIENSVFHFTGNKQNDPIETLISIIVNGFYPKYNKEYLNNIIKPLGKKQHFWGVPMVCFCGYGLREIKPHLKDFGYYGIGLTKNWAFKNNLKPVKYLDPNSDEVNQFNVIYDHNINKFLKYKNNTEWYNFLSEAVFIQDAKYTNERELRHIPDVWNDNSLSKVLDPIFYTSSYSDLTLNYQNEKLMKFSLNFEFDDINFIIIPEDMIDVTNNRLTTLNSNYVKLMDKVISTNHIIELFG